jgi:uncharacterized membrane protein YbhN (UPF0104 family)
VVLDRFIGLASLVLLAASCVPWQWALLSTSRETYAVAVSVVAAAAVVCAAGLLFFAAGRPTHRWFEKPLRFHSARALRDEAVRVWGLFCCNKVVVAKLLGAALAAQFIQCVSFYLAGVAVGIDRPLFVWLTFLPIVFAANAVPITVAGIGVREYLLILFLGVVARVDRESAFAASLVMLSMMLVISLAGGLLYIFYRPQPKRTGFDEGVGVV